MKGEAFKCKMSAKYIFKHSVYAQYNLKSIACVPVIDTSGNAVGSIVIMDPKEREFSDDEIQLIRIFARYIAFEIEREAMEVKLLHAQKLEVIGNLAGGVAHEVQKPSECDHDLHGNSVQRSCKQLKIQAFNFSYSISGRSFVRINEGPVKSWETR